MSDPTAKIDAKEKFHFMDAERYLIGQLKSPRPQQIYKLFESFVAHRGLDL
jgi:hypothetical protein